MRIMNWTVLDIEPTQDKKAIAAAYRTQLMHTNPEAFKALRAAYEEALKLAECPAEERNCDETPVGRWMKWNLVRREKTAHSEQKR